MWNQTSENNPKTYEWKTDEGILYVDYDTHNSAFNCALIEVGIRSMSSYLFTRDDKQGEWGDLDIAKANIELLKKHLPKLRDLPDDEMKELMNLSDLEAQIQ
jgi:hypothetical protein